MSSMEELGRTIDARLASLGVTLTQGGEPTYVPQRPDKPEWNTEAVGPEKLPYARRLAYSLVRALFPGAVAIKVQGKQYPGENLPRWALTLYRRREGAPLWANPERLLFDPTSTNRPTSEMPQRLLAAAAEALNLPFSPQPVFEDVGAWLRREHPEQAAQLRVSVQRALNRVEAPAAIDYGRLSGWETVSRPAGWALPLEVVDGRWVSGEWRIPGEPEITLVSGAHPLGLRLPLGRLPPQAIRCAITAEIRDGELTVFLPPCPGFAAFCELVATLEAAATDERLPPLALEGYPPPFDRAWESLALTSDPGVIEINLPPAESFAELTHCLRTLHAAATRVGLSGRKLMFNGRRTGTGGGAHILFGGPSLEANPFVQRPFLLASLLRFLCAHPSLSYAFSGLYLGPSCQAPRPDETVPGMLDELEIALAALESLRSPGDPALIDRLLRSLLLDWNGNTHRAEVCVDKFCNPFAPNGRLGVVELRAVEMFPDVEDNLAVNLLFRSLLTAFIARPYREPLRRWSNAERERFLLPEALREDLDRVVAFLGDAGIEYPPSLLEPILEFRFPLLHAWEEEACRLEVRQAADFWCAMGESGGGTSRRVDASTDRIQVALHGAQAEDHQVLVHGWKLALEKSPRGLRYCGIRYQAFTSDHGLHPHLRPHVPLLIEIVGGGTVRHAWRYSPWRFDGGDYAGMPKDEADALARIEERSRALPDRVGRAVVGRVPTVPPAANATLDLRRVWDGSR
jgi:uncharacterized protein (DUF2126 family)